MDNNESLIPKHGGYRKLKSFQVAQLVYDITVRFCDRYISPISRTHDQMVQAARSGVQNIAEGSEASATSRKMEIKLTQVARASLEELKLDFEDYLRQREFTLWCRDDPKGRELIDLRATSADEIVRWVHLVNQREASPYSEIAANAALVLINVDCSLLHRQVASLAQAFENNGGFTERLYRTRKKGLG